MEEAAASCLALRQSPVTIVHPHRATLRASRPHAGRAFADPESSSSGDSEVAEIKGDPKARRSDAAQPQDGRDVRAAGDEVCSSRSATTRGPRLFKGQLEAGRRGLPEGRRPLDAHQPDRPSSAPAATLLDHTYRQAIAAAGTVLAALSNAERFLARAGRRVSRRGRRPRPPASGPGHSRPSPENVPAVAGSLKNVTVASFDEDVTQERQAVLGGLLGGLVRPAPPDRAVARSHRSPSTATQIEIVKLNIDENPGTAARVRRHVDPDPERLLGWRRSPKTIVGVPSRKFSRADRGDFIAE